jgi:hypothetical protein
MKPLAVVRATKSPRVSPRGVTKTRYALFASIEAAKTGSSRTAAAPPTSWAVPVSSTVGSVVFGLNDVTVAPPTVRAKLLKRAVKIHVPGRVDKENVVSAGAGEDKRIRRRSADQPDVRARNIRTVPVKAFG